VSIWELPLKAPLLAHISSRGSSHEELPSRLLLMGDPMGANGSCYRAPREALKDLLMGAVRFFSNGSSYWATTGSSLGALGELLWSS